MRDGVKIRLEVLHVRGRVNRGKEEDVISIESVEGERGRSVSPFM